jgi:hypothetical protein
MFFFECSYLCRSLWIFLSICIQKIEVENQNTTAANKKLLKRIENDAVLILTALFSELYERCKFIGDDNVLTLYTDALLVTVSRCIEKKVCRALIKLVLLGIPVIPHSCIYLISIIALRSSGALISEKLHLKDLLALLCDITREAQSRSSRIMALQTILWFSISDDFDVRVKAVSYLTKCVCLLIIYILVFTHVLSKFVGIYLIRMMLSLL